MKRFVVGDIHGAHKALLQCLERASFNYEEDLLISLGDVCDGWPDVSEVIEELLRIKHLKMIFGNHDAWMLRWIEEGKIDRVWRNQGGQATLDAYQSERGNVPQSHHALLKTAMPYLEMDNKLFVHGGINANYPLDKQDNNIFLWDRNLLREAIWLHEKKPGFRFGAWTDIFIGHTPTEVYETLEPMHVCNVWAMDTGAGWSGKLTLLDIDSYEYWQSDSVPELYPNAVGRGAGRQ